MEDIIYHVVKPVYWAQFSDKDNYVPERYEEEGFIHCCTEAQIDHVLTNYYKGVPKIFLLQIEVERLTSELKWEPAIGQLFPHIYGPMNKEAVVDMRTIKQVV
ncbi:MAG: DUF952 domain-containing protein [Bacteroidota bacterium]